MSATRCKNCGGPLGHPESIALGLDGPCVERLGNPRTALALADALVVQADALDSCIRYLLGSGAQPEPQAMAAVVMLARTALRAAGRR